MENLRVLELATYIAGPGASLIFTELGATTIKVGSSLVLTNDHSVG